MKKYLGVYVLGALLCASVVAVASAPRDSAGALSSSRLGVEQLSQLDARLNQKIAEQQELMRIVERLLQISATQNQAAASVSPTPLSGTPRLPAVVRAAPAPAAVVPPVAPPWWVSYKLQLVYWSGDSAEAVINGKMYRKGQALGNEVWVENIESGSVVLARGSERHTYWLNK